MLIPQSVFDLYNKTADDMITLNFGVNCLITYPELRSACVNCIYNTTTKRSSNQYNGTGPSPFPASMLCPVCNGDGYRVDSPTEILKLRTYWSRKDWAKLAANIVTENTAVMVIGFMSDLPKIKKMQSIILNSDLTAYAVWKFFLEGEPVPWGFQKNRYFIASMTRNIGVA